MTRTAPVPTIADTAVKRQYGAYYTESNPFDLRPFQDWACSAELDRHTVLEPFAGANNIVRMLQDALGCTKFACYDIAGDGTGKSEKGGDGTHIQRQDTLKSFPTGYRACVTNPPWLARNSARRRGLEFAAPEKYDDIYKYALQLALENCKYVGFIIPATFLRTHLFRSRLRSFVLLEQQMFADTDNPVCLALFTPRPARTEVWSGNNMLGYLDEIEAKYHQNIQAASDKSVRFNVPDGSLGLIGVDGITEASIRFCSGSELSHRTVKHTDRAIVRIDPGVGVTDEMLDQLNDTLQKFRKDTHDVFLAPFKGLRADMRYRRRLDFATARGLIASAWGHAERPKNKTAEPRKKINQPLSKWFV